MSKRATRKPKDSNPGTPPNVLLIGLRGSGKSTVGPRLAEAIGHQFIDLDPVTLWRLKCATVEEAWRAHGAPRFREMEVEALRDALGHPARVIAAGGGTPTAPDAVKLIQSARGAGGLVVVYLRVLPAILRRRLQAPRPAEAPVSRAGDPNRPSLTGRDPVEEIEDIYTQRDPRYSELADSLVNGEKSPDEVVADIMQMVVGRDMVGRTPRPSS